MIRILSQWCGSADPDPYQNVTDPKHWKIPCETLHVDSEQLPFELKLEYILV
jgi:hypothetical protein